jgi:hypothetical protein
VNTKHINTVPRKVIITILGIGTLFGAEGAGTYGAHHDWFDMLLCLVIWVACFKAFDGLLAEWKNKSK